MADTQLTDMLVLTFTEDSKDRRIKIPDPRMDLTGREVKEAMDLVADTDYIWKGAIPKSAKIVKTSTDQIDITVE